jgi:CHASE2 domain-containing sensor protein
MFIGLNKSANRPLNSPRDGLTAKFLQVDVRLSRAFVLGLSLCITVMLYLSLYPSLHLVEERLGNLGWTIFPETQLEERVVIVAIDERSIAAVGPWPWSREKMAQLVSAIDNAGAQLQLHDIAYSDPRPGDEDLIAALEASSGAVISQIPILSANSTYLSEAESINVGVMTHPVNGLSCNNSGVPSIGFPSSSSFIAADVGFASIPKGHIAPLLNADGSISKQPAVICVEGKPYPALAVSALHQASRLSRQDDMNLSATVNLNGGLLGPAQRLTLDGYPGLEIPLDDDGNLRVSYASHPSSYQAVSAVDLLDGSADFELLRGAWVLVGATAFGLDDVVPTPYSSAAPGVELQARILGSILDLSMPFTPKAANLVLAFICLFFAVVLMRMGSFTGRLGSIVSPSLIVFFPLISLGVHIQLLSSLSVWLGWVFPSLFGGISASMILLLEQARVRSQRNRVLGNLESYLPKDVAHQIAFSIPSSDIKAERRDVTLLSADLRNFSLYSESRPAEESAAVLHFFFQTATRIVEKCKGRIQEFNGDSLLAIWDDQGTESAERAYRAAVQMLDQINYQLLAQYAPDGLEPLVVGVGIEQGPALIGTIGPAHRRAQALLGDTVTIVLRLQEMTADLSQPILFGECVARQIQSTQLQSQGSYLLAGLANPHIIFAPAPGESRSDDDRSTPKLKLLAGGRR